MKLHTKDVGADCDLEKIAAECVQKCYSGRDLSTICQKAIHIMVNDKNPNLYELARLPFEEIQKRKLNTRPLILTDFNEAMKTTNPPVNSTTLRKYEQWNKEFWSIRKCTSRGSIHLTSIMQSITKKQKQDNKRVVVILDALARIVVINGQVFTWVSLMI